MTARALSGEELLARIWSYVDPQTGPLLRPSLKEVCADAARLLAHIAALERQVAEARAMRRKLECAACWASPAVYGAIVLRRINRKGETGVFMCDACLKESPLLATLETERMLRVQLSEDSQRHLDQMIAQRQRAEEAERQLDQVRTAWETACREREELRDYAATYEAQREGLRAVALIADSWSPFKEPLHTALVELARVWPTWRNTPPRVAEGEGRA